QAGDIVFAPGPGRLSNPSDFSNASTEMTLGFNWYLNRWVRVQFNWEHAWFDQPVRLGPGSEGRMASQDTLMTRLQVIFCTGPSPVAGRVAGPSSHTYNSPVSFAPFTSREVRTMLNRFFLFFLSVLALALA